MNQEELKDKMKKLWKSTFHDSDSYISLIFDNYFNLELVEYKEENGQLISALLGIPYEFGNGNNNIKGLYLCGLATVNEFRHRGIMNELLEKINIKAQEKGYVFTFLIPANDSLINYYSVRKYETAIYRIEERYTELHNFDKDYRLGLDREDENIRLLKERLFDTLSTEPLDINDSDVLKSVIDFIYNYERSNSTYTTLLHSRKDIEIILKENAISHGKIFISFTKDRTLTGVAFLTIDERKRVHIPKIYHKDQPSMFKLLDGIKKRYPDSPISIYCYPEECDRRILWEQTYGVANPDGGMLGGAYGVVERIYNVSSHAKPYGMVRILRLYEILKFLAKDRNDSKFSILVKRDEPNYAIVKCDVKDGDAKFEEVSEELARDMINQNNMTLLKERELLELIFRKKGSSNLIQEAFGIPRLSINMSLLLD